MKKDIPSMHGVELRVERAKFAEILASLRQWIDHSGANPVNFQSTTDPSGCILVRLEFSGAELASQFQREWAHLAIQETPRAA